MENNIANFEMIIGLVSPIGVDLDKVIKYIQSTISPYNYDVHVIKVVDLPNLLNDKGNLLTRVALDNLSTQMPALREVAHRHIKSDGVDGFDVFAAMIIKQIQKIRIEKPNQSKRLYILDNLKHPQDIESLQRVYKKAFYTVGVTATINQRIQFKYFENNGTNPSDLSESKTKSGLNKAARDVYEDYGFTSSGESKNKWANDTGKAYQLSDYFINLGEFSDIDKELESVIARFIDLICGAPIITPRPREHSMFLAYMYSLRTADLSRQVGSTITNDDHDVLALGANETPKAGGGQYWADEKYVAHTSDNASYLNNGIDQRDFVQGFDANARVKDEIFAQIIDKLKKDDLIKENDENDKKLLEALKSTSLNDITEYGRVVHAEMSSLMSAARNGISVKGSHMYCTTYPCHNCAKHIIAAGISSVEYIEPYPKSKANLLHKDSIYDPDAIVEEGEFSKEEILKKMTEYFVQSVEAKNKEGLKVQFRPYSGVGPKKYLDLFSMKLGDSRKVKRKNGSKAIYLNKANHDMPRVSVIVEQSVFNENQFLKELNGRESNILENIIAAFNDENGISQDKRIMSQIKFWEEEHKYGYIKTVKAGKDYGFNLTNLDEKDTPYIKIGKQVSFVLKQGSDGVYFADNIIFIDDEKQLIHSKIKSWCSIDGKGFIQAECGKDIVFYKDKVKTSDRELLKVGTPVTFKRRESNKGFYYAFEVAILDDA